MNVVTLLSGGLDSAVLLYHLLSQGHKVRCLTVNYGQRHRKELVSAKNLCALVGAEHRVADIAHLRGLFAGSSQTTDGVDVPDGHYEDPSMRLTVVPNRNMVLLSLAGAWAVSTKSQAVAYAAHAGDHAVYPDCRPEFCTAVGVALNLCDYEPVELMRPFLHPKPLSKADVVKLGLSLKVPFHATWSCYKGGERHCGKCGTCFERHEAFILAGVDDPTDYETQDVWRKDTGNLLDLAKEPGPVRIKALGWEGKLGG